MLHNKTSNSLSIAQAVSAIRQGDVIAYPTETVWGLGCDLENTDALSRLLMIKHRSAAKGLILLGSSLEQFAPYLSDSLTQKDLARLQQSNERPTTWLVPYSNALPLLVVGQFSTVGIRLTTQPTVAALCSALGRPLISTSANPAGCQPARFQFQLKRYFGDTVPIVKGQLAGNGKQAPSMIRELQSGKIIRH